MSIKLVRQASATPNITNREDAVMARHAYGSSRGVVGSYGNECSYSYNSSSGIFTLNSGRIVIDGWEIDIDSVGHQLYISPVMGTTYVSVFVEVDLSVESVSLNYSYGTSSYPTVTSGDNLTKYPYGKARLNLYDITFNNG